MFGNPDFVIIEGPSHGRVLYIGYGDTDGLVMVLLT